MSQKESHLLLPVDSAWLALERPENPMTITVMLRVEGLTEARLLEFLRIYWLAWERFRYMPVRRAPGWWWEEDPVFSLHHHLQVVVERKYRVLFPPPARGAANRHIAKTLPGKPVNTQEFQQPGFREPFHPQHNGNRHGVFGPLKSQPGRVHRQQQMRFLLTQTCLSPDKCCKKWKVDPALCQTSPEGSIRLSASRSYKKLHGSNLSPLYWE